MKWLARELLTTQTALPDGAGLLKFATVERDATLGEARRVRVVCSTSAPDREKDVIVQSGWQLRNYQKNPVVMFGHDYHSLPVGKAVVLHIDGDRLVMETEFATADENPFADVCYKLVKGGYLNAVSVGFRPIKWNYDEDRKGINFLEQELLEVSWVPIPAHPQALVEARDAGLDLTLLKQWHEGLGEQLKELEPEPERKTLTSGNHTFVLPEGAKVDSVTLGDFSKTLVNGGTGALDAPADKTADIESTVADTAEKIAGLVKSGRVLSAANESKIRSAVDALSDVLSALETADDGKTHSQQVQKTDAAADPDFIDLEGITTDHDDITLSAEEIAAIRALVRESVTAQLTPLTGRVV